jgi:hypothetical protein
MSVKTLFFKTIRSNHAEVCGASGRNRRLLL